MRLFKATYRDTSGKTQEAPKWTVEFRDHLEIVRRITLFVDEKASAEFGRKLERLVALRIAGEAPDVPLTRWLETIQARVKDKLAEIGLVEGQRAKTLKPLTDHLTDWKSSLLADEISPARIQVLHCRVTHTMSVCGFTYLSDIDAEETKQHLAERRKAPKEKTAEDVKDRPALKDGISAQTYNDTVQALKQFGAWLVETDRLTVNPFKSMGKLTVETDRRHDRRALTAIEVSKLIAAAESGPVRNGMTGAARAMLYQLALNTGIRAGELRQLTRASLDLERHSVTLDAKQTKNRKASVLPLRKDLALRLAVHTTDMLPSALLFKMPPKWDVIEMLKADLIAADVKYLDASGRFADFHSLRHTFITNLAQSGVHPKVAQDLARHSDINLTLSRYSHTVMEQRAEAVAKLPELVATIAQSIAEGTTGNHLASHLAFCGGKQGISKDVSGQTAQRIEGGNKICKSSGNEGIARVTRENSGMEMKSHLSDLNRGPMLYESIALPAELRWHWKNLQRTFQS